MALLSSAEKEKLKEQGLYVREKCDKCGKPILSPVSYIKGKEVWCSECAGKSDLARVNIKKENAMKKEKDAKSKEPKQAREKVGGVLTPGTAIAEMYLVLRDNKKHAFKDCKKICDQQKVSVTGRLYQLGVYGRHEDAEKGGWGLTINEDTIQLTHGKEAASAKKVKIEKKEPKKAPKEESTGDVSSRTIKMVAQQLRRTLKSGKDWTKNKLIQSLVKSGVDQKAVEAALKSEIKAGGITAEGGELSLA